MNGEVNNQRVRRIKTNIRRGEEPAAAMSQLRRQGCCSREKKKMKKRAEEGVISEGREGGERGAEEGDMIQPYMAIDKRDG